MSLSLSAMRSLGRKATVNVFEIGPSDKSLKNIEKTVIVLVLLFMFGTLSHVMFRTLRSAGWREMLKKRRESFDKDGGFAITYPPLTDS